MTRRLPHAAALVGAVVLALAAAVGCTETPTETTTEAQTPGNGRSVVLIVVDTLRADRLGAYGYARPTTPALDRWAERGALFEHAFASSAWTLPSFGSMFTGYRPSRHLGGQRLEPGGNTRTFAMLDADMPTLATVLRDAGYWTAAVLSNPWLNPVFGMTRGFDDYVNLKSVRPGEGGARAKTSVDRALALLDEKRPSGQPFLLVVHLMDPHLPYAPPAGISGRFSRDGTSAFAQPLGDVKAIRNSVGTLTTRDRAFVADSYDEEVRSVDRQVGRLLRGLDRRGIFAESLVLLTADHGEELFDHGGFEHGHSTYQEILHVPLLAWGVGVEPGRRIAAPVSHVDVLPTVLASLELPRNAALQGRSFWSQISAAAEAPEPRTLYAEGLLYGAGQLAVVRWPWKLIQTEDLTPQLFNLERDPRERQNVAAAHPERVKSMQEVSTEGAGHRAAELDEELQRALREIGYLE